MAVLIQELVRPEFSFVIHTVNPVSHLSNELYAELVVGLGETLVSAAEAASPYGCVATRQTVLWKSWASPISARRDARVPTAVFCGKRWITRRST